MAISYENSEEATVLGTRLRFARRNLNLTLTNLTEKTGVSHSQISRIERGLFKGPSKNVRILCNFLKIDDLGIRHADEPQFLALRLELLASSSPKWRSVVAAFADALEAAQNAPRPHN